MSEETIAVEVEKKPLPVKAKITRRRSGGQKRPVRKAVTQEGERPNRSKPTRVKYADRNRISFDGMEPGFVYRAVNDTPGRIEKFRGMGYELVESEQQLGDYRVAEGSKMGRAVSKPVGNGTTGYLMRIKKEYYDEDQKAKAQRVDATEAALKPAKSKEEYGPGLTND